MTVQLLTIYADPERHNTQRYRPTDDIMMPRADILHAVRSAKNCLCMKCDLYSWRRWQRSMVKCYLGCLSCRKTSTSCGRSVTLSPATMTRAQPRSVQHSLLSYSHISACTCQILI